MIQPVADALPGFIKAVNEKMTDYWARHYPNLTARQVKVGGGEKYIKIVEVEHGEVRSIYCFIDASNGDVLMPASFKKPAKHARGNILTGDPVNDGCCGPHGVRYMGTTFSWE